MNPVIRDWRGKRIWIIGASSGIGEETARPSLTLGARVALSARKLAQLQKIAADYPMAEAVTVDICDHAEHRGLPCRPDAKMGRHRSGTHRCRQLQ